MARYSERDTSTIYEAAERFRAECLKRDGSLLFDGSALWTKENLAKLHERFNAAPDTGDRGFTEKFRDQVEPAGEAVVRLAAELVAIYFLFPSNVGGNRKKALVDEVLGWSGATLAEDQLVARAFAAGIGSGGQGYNTRRPDEIGFLIEFAMAWKKLSNEEQAKALTDPWRFESVVDDVDGADTRQFRHMILHLLFPDQFERIASGSHKRRVIQAFQGLVSDPPDDDDKHLYAIRKELERLLPGQQLDFYWKPLEAAWYDASEASGELAPLEVVRHKKQVVLYGPPGTGKTFTAKRLADRIIRSAALAKFGPSKYFQEAKDVDEAIRARTRRLQLHAAFGYEDFIRGLHISKAGGTEYRRGYLPELIKEMEEQDAAKRLPYVLILDEINRTDLSRMLGECFSLLEDRNQTIQLPGRDADGKAMTLKIPDDLYIVGTMNLIDQSIEQIDFALRRRFLWIPCPFDADALLSAAEAKWRTEVTTVDWERVEGDFQRLAEAATALNSEVSASALLGPQYEIGHTYLLDVVSFLKDDLGPRPTRARKHYLWKQGEARRPVEQVWKLSLRPLLHEYLSGLEASAREKELKRLEAAFLYPPESSA